MQPEKQAKYYIHYKMFMGDEFTGESVTSGHITEAESDKEAIEKLYKHVVDEKRGEVTLIFTCKRIEGDFQLICDALQVEAKELSDTQKYNISWMVIHGLNCKHNFVHDK